MIDKQDLLQALKDTLKDPALYSAICSNVRGQLARFPQYKWGLAVEVDNSLGLLFERWPKYSGNPRYPVPSVTAGFSAENQFNTTCLGSDSFWEGEYGALRKELLQFCIGQLENEDHGT